MVRVEYIVYVLKDLAINSNHSIFRNNNRPSGILLAY